MISHHQESKLESRAMSYKAYHIWPGLLSDPFSSPSFCLAPSMLAFRFLQTSQVGLRAFALAISSAWKAFPLWPLLVHYVSAIMYHIRDAPITSSFTISPSSLYSTHIHVHVHMLTLRHSHAHTYTHIQC